MKHKQNNSGGPQRFKNHPDFVKALWDDACLIAGDRLRNKGMFSAIEPEDIATEVFKVAEQREMWLNCEKDYLAWLTTCITNKAIDMVHRPAKNKKNRDAAWSTESVDTTESCEGDEALFHEHPAFTKEAKQRFDDFERKKDNLEILFRFLGTLPELNRKLAYLVESEGFSVAQAAQSLNINYVQATSMMKDFSAKSKDYFRRNSLLGVASWVADLPDMTLYLQM